MMEDTFNLVILMGEAQAFCMEQQIRYIYNNINNELKIQFYILILKYKKKNEQNDI